jgi:beta-glucanase (GH16 family)
MPNINVTIAGPDDGALFFDDFNGSGLDSSKWTGPYNRIMDDVNGEVGAMVPSAVAVESGLLKITSRYVPEGITIGDSITSPTTRYYTSGQVHAKPTFLYGTVEMRAKAPGGTGLWPLFWLLGHEWQASQPSTANTPEHNWPHEGWCELDIMEFLANSRTTNNCAVWFYNGDTGNGSADNGNMSVNATSQFIIYRLEWQANLLQWSVSYDDGANFSILRTITDPDQIPNEAMYVVLSTAVGGVVGTPDPDTFPQTYEIDWVRITT